MKQQTIALGRLLANRGVASRRKAEDLVFEGLVTVDGVKANHPALEVDPTQQVILVDGEELPAEPDAVYYLFYKPKGCITGRNDPQGRKSIFDHLEALGLTTKVEPVGRLDFDTEGALLLTNDGNLAHALTHPSREVPKRYRVKVWKTPTEQNLVKIRKGQVYLEDGRVPPCKVRIADDTDAGNTWLEITVTEGRNRLIRRLFAQLGHPVSKLRRESFATISLRDLERGRVRPLTGDEVNRLQDLAAGRKPERAGQRRYKPGFARPKPKKARHGQRKDKRRVGASEGGEASRGPSNGPGRGSGKAPGAGPGQGPGRAAVRGSSSVPGKGPSKGPPRGR